jgi:hypothetical protein
VTNLIATGASITSANVGALQVTNASVASANFGTAQITAVSAASANLGVAAITTGTVTDLTATSASVASMNAGVALLTTATVTTLNASGASIASANIGNLQFTAASIASINAGVAVINNLTATSASIASANVGVALITTGTVTALTATGASVASANVGTAVITGLTVTGASIASVNAGTATLSGNLTLNGGTANGVLFLNGSKVATSGSALTFDGTNFATTGRATANDFLATGSAYYATVGGVTYGSLIATGGAGALTLNANNGSNLIFQVASTEGFRLTSSTLYTASGINVGIGTSSPEALLTVSKSTSGGEGGYIYLDNPAASASGNKAGIKFGTSSGASFASVPTGEITNVIDNSGNGASALTFGTFNGTSSGERARITSGGILAFTDTNADKIQLNGAAANYYMISKLAGSASLGDGEFRLTAGNTSAGSFTFSSAGTERARITSGGFFKASNTGTYSSSTNDRYEFTSDKNDLTILVNSTNTGANVNNVYSQLPAAANAGAYHFVGSISGSGLQFTVDADGDVKNTNNSYGSISDIKLKQDVVDATSQWDDIKALRVRKYRFKRNPDAALQIGLVAQEAEAVSPGLVEETADRDEEGNDLGTTTKSVKYSVLYMKAVKALQEAMTRIEQLEAKVAALESK